MYSSSSPHNDETAKARAGDDPYAVLKLSLNAAGIVVVTPADAIREHLERYDVLEAR